MFLRLFTLSCLILGFSCTEAPPSAVGPVPSERHLAWHELQYYAFVHFNMNTFTDMEWGTGGELPGQFNPSELDTRQWAKIAKEAGMKGIIITAKHHDGFCLWPTSTTEHSVKNSPWKEGKGDLIKELSEACAEYGLKFGIYLSPWDRNHEAYGKPEYVADFHQQLRELLTNYGEVFEVWFDGANGGSGYYGGANETRKIDNKTYYEWEKTTQIVRELQPNAVIFSDGGPDIRWVGTEEGWANETNWSVMRRDEIYPGWPRYVELRSGHEDGTHWLPAEVNTSIRPGWYYHPREDHQVKSLPRLVRTYYESIGRNGNFLLNLPVDKRGLVHEEDAAKLMALKRQIDADFEFELGGNAKVSASNVRGGDTTYSADKVNDGEYSTYWATDNGVTKASLTFEFEGPAEVNRILLQEYIPLGQRVKKFSVEAEIDGKWTTLDIQTTIGYKRILQFNTVVTTQIRVNFLEAKGPLTISTIVLYRAPNFLVVPQLERNRAGEVTLSVPDPEVEMYYTLDGSEPSNQSMRFSGLIKVEAPVTLKAIGYDPQSGKTSEIITYDLDIPKKEWQVISSSSGDLAKAGLLIDEKPHTFWATDEKVNAPQEIVIDLGRQEQLLGFTYWPIQERYPFGIITGYEFSVSNDNQNWTAVATGEFSNIVNSRLQQRVTFSQIDGRYIKLRALTVDGTGFQASFAELGVLTK